MFIKKHRRFGGFRQQDANEFTACLLDQLSQEEAGRPPRPDVRSVVDRVFQGRQQTCVTCTACGTSYYTESLFTGLNVPVASSLPHDSERVTDQKVMDAIQTAKLPVHQDYESLHLCPSIEGCLARHTFPDVAQGFKCLYCTLMWYQAALTKKLSGELDESTKKEYQDHLVTVKEGLELVSEASASRRPLSDEDTEPYDTYFTRRPVRQAATVRVALVGPAAPQVLMIALTRFKQTGVKVVKNNDPVGFRETLDMAPFSIGGPAPRYRLRGVTIHSGGLGGGHYTAVCRAGATWTHYSDSSVRSGVKPDVQPYVLFYERIDEEKEDLDESPDLE